MTATLEPPTEQTMDTTPVFSVEGLWKVFGPKAERIPGDPELTALDPAELRSRTGCTAAVRDVTFDIRATWAIDQAISVPPSRSGSKVGVDVA